MQKPLDKTRIALYNIYVNKKRLKKSGTPKATNSRVTDEPKTDRRRSCIFIISQVLAFVKKERINKMTNAQIIFNASVKLMEDGILSGTGHFMKVTNEDGTEKSIEIPEEIHTFAGWKTLGYSVQKGQKAIAQIDIWKHTTKFLDENVPDEKNRCIQQRDQRSRRNPENVHEKSIFLQGFAG